jgi:hypothetical protein
MARPNCPIVNVAGNWQRIELYWRLSRVGDRRRYLVRSRASQKGIEGNADRRAIVSRLAVTPPVPHCDKDNGNCNTVGRPGGLREAVDGLVQFHSAPAG